MSSGVALLEALVAVAVLAVAGSALAMAITQSSAAVAAATEAERELRRASALLDAVSLWPRADLDRRLGEREQGAWRLRIQRPDERLYTVQVADSTGTRVLLETMIYREWP